jgi:ferredoxin
VTRVVVDRDLCEGHARCVETAPEVFEVGDDDYAQVIRQPTPELLEKVREAVRRCPRMALSLEED